jgi:hypothetical protein
VEAFKEVKDVIEYGVLLGTGVMAIYYGLKRVYKLARTVESIFDHVVEDKKERDILTKNLNDHIKMESDKDAIRDQQFIQIVDDLKDVAREVRPNGGSSMKDTLNHVSHEVSHVKERLARVEQWKDDSTQG